MLIRRHPYKQLEIEPSKFDTALFTYLGVTRQSGYQTCEIWLFEDGTVTLQGYYAQKGWNNTPAQITLDPAMPDELRRHRARTFAAYAWGFFKTHKTRRVWRSCPTSVFTMIAHDDMAPLAMTG